MSVNHHTEGDISAHFACAIPSILNTTGGDTSAKLADVADSPAFLHASAELQAHRFDRFAWDFIRPFENLAEAMIAKNIAEDERLNFLILRQDFVGSHLQALFEQFEGSAYCADKERCVMFALIRFFKTGQPIEFDYSEEHSYSRPKILLRDHDNIVGYFDSLYDLYYGKYGAYVKKMQDFAMLAENTDADRDQT